MKWKKCQEIKVSNKEVDYAQTTYPTKEGIIEFAAFNGKKKLPESRLKGHGG
jgi:hypothetical protein